MIFDKDELRIDSRRKNESFKKIKYADIKYVEHSYSKTPQSAISTRNALLGILGVGNPLLDGRDGKHWLTLLTENDFVVLKIENDSFRLLRMKFLVRDFDIVNLNENLWERRLSAGRAKIFEGLLTPGLHFRKSPPARRGFSLQTDRFNAIFERVFPEFSFS